MLWRVMFGWLLRCLYFSYCAYYATTTTNSLMIPVILSSSAITYPILISSSLSSSHLFRIVSSARWNSCRSSCCIRSPTAITTANLLRSIATLSQAAAIAISSSTIAAHTITKARIRSHPFSSLSLIAHPSSSRHSRNNNRYNHQFLVVRKMSSSDSDKNNNNEYNVDQVDIGQQEPQGRHDGKVDGVDATTTTIATAPNQKKSPSLSSSWRTLLERSNQKSRSQRGSNYVQLATMDPLTQEPRCRTIVFRGFVKQPTAGATEENDLVSTFPKVDGLSCILKMITDERSQKVNQIVTNPHITTTTTNNNNAEMVWWFPNTKEQYRIRGTLVFVGSGNSKYPLDHQRSMQVERTEQWYKLTDSGRQAFLDPNVPGESYTTTPVTTPPDNAAATSNDATSSTIPPPPDNFLLMLLLPSYCDYLNLKTNYRQMDTFIRQQQQQDCHDSDDNDMDTTTTMTTIPNNSNVTSMDGEWTSMRVNS